MLLYRTASEAQERLGSAERCEVCGAWSASRSENPKGAIVGPRLDDDGHLLADRLCCECDEMDESHIRRTMSEKVRW